MEVQTLGRASIAVHGLAIPESAWETRQAIVLLVFLALHPGRAFPADPGTISGLRRTLRDAGAADPLSGEAGLYSWQQPEAHIDARQFEELCLQQQFLEALHLYRGPFMDGYDEPWIDLERTRLHHLFMRAQEGVARAHEEAGDHSHAMVRYQRLLDIDPCHEDAHAGLIRCLVATGRRADAIRQYHECARLLQQHFHLEPGEPLQQLYRTLGL